MQHVIRGVRTLPSKAFCALSGSSWFLSGCTKMDNYMRRGTKYWELRYKNIMTFPQHPHARVMSSQTQQPRDLFVFCLPPETFSSARRLLHLDQFAAPENDVHFGRFLQPKYFMSNVVHNNHTLTKASHHICKPINWKENWHNTWTQS